MKGGEEGLSHQLFSFKLIFSSLSLRAPHYIVNSEKVGPQGLAQGWDLVADLVCGMDGWTC